MGPLWKWIRAWMFLQRIILVPEFVYAFALMSTSRLESGLMLFLFKFFPSLISKAFLSMFRTNIVAAETKTSSSISRSPVLIPCSVTNASASWGLTRLRWITPESYSMSEDRHLVTLPVALVKLRTHLMAWWLVWRVQLLACRYVGRSKIAQTKLRHLQCVIIKIWSWSITLLEQCQIGLSTMASSLCSYTGSMYSSHASVSSV